MYGFSIELFEEFWYKFLFKTNISDSNLCILCGKHCETMKHLFSSCEKADSLWSKITYWIKTKIGYDLNLTETDKILGCVFKEHSFWAINFILLSARCYIFRSAKQKRDLYLSNLQNLIKEKFIEQEMLSRVNNTSENFEKRWSLWSQIFTDI